MTRMGTSRMSLPSESLRTPRKWPSCVGQNVNTWEKGLSNKIAGLEKHIDRLTRNKLSA